MASNYRTPCPFCKEEVLSNRLGKHIFSNHKNALFESKINRNLLFKPASERSPISFDLPGDSDGFWCVGCKAFCRREAFIDKHMTPCRQKIAEQLQALREAYPLGEPLPAQNTERAPPLISEKERKYIQEDFAELIGHLRTLEGKLGVDEAAAFSFTKRTVQALQKLSLTVDDEGLKEMYPNLFPEPEAEEASEEIEAEELPSDDFVEDTPPSPIPAPPSKSRAQLTIPKPPPIPSAPPKTPLTSIKIIANTKRA